MLLDSQDLHFIVAITFFIIPLLVFKFNLAIIFYLVMVFTFP